MLETSVARKKIAEMIAYRKDRADNFGEVFTPFELIEEHVANIDASIFSDPTSTFLDPCAGFGSYPLVLIERLMEGLKKWEPDKEKRMKHVIENQIYMVELQKESCDIIQQVLNPRGEYKLNLYNQSFLEDEESSLEDLFV
jgi:type I restriction-modification system DNA methylase subunit